MSEPLYPRRVQLFASDRLVDAFELMARENDMTFSALVRMAMQEFLRTHGIALSQPRPNGHQPAIGVDHGQ
jgi:hypothetical protein